MNPHDNPQAEKDDVRNPRGKRYDTPGLTVHGTIEELTESGSGTAMDLGGLGSTPA